MSIHRTSKSGLFLLELIIIIFFFAMTSAVCVRLFVHAHLTSQASQDLSHAVLAVESAAEYVKDAGGDQAALAAGLNLQPQPDGTLAAFYDRDWNPTNVATAAHTLLIRQEEKDGMLSAQVAMTDSGNWETAIFELQVKRYLGEKEGAAP